MILNPPEATINNEASRTKEALLNLLSKWGPAISIGIAFTALFVWSWGRWGDPITDLGRELYVPWRLAQGEVLYRDIAYFNGPLSPYFNAVWFGLFGPGVWTLVSVNCGVLIGMLAMMFYIVQYIADRFSATVFCIFFLCIFAFGVIMPGGNFTYLLPYSHEMTHGVFLLLGLLASLIRFMEKRRLFYFFWPPYAPDCCNSPKSK